MEHTEEFKLIELLLKKGLTVSTAESCTGGMVAARLTSVSGASGAFPFGAVTYCNEAKNKVLGVSGKTLDAFGAVSAETAKEMAENVRKIMGTDIGISVTGVAGPNSSEGKPIGLVYTAVSGEAYSAVAENHFSGDRESIRKQAADTVLQMALRAAEEAKKK